MSQENNEIIAGRNAVLEALRAERPLNKIVLQEGAHGGSLNEIIALAKERRIPIENAKQEKLDKLAVGVRHQGIVALGAPIAFASLDDVFQKAEEKSEPPFIILLDELQDPQNVGAIIRTADAAGVHGVLMPKRRACPLNSVVAKISAGAINYVPIVQIGNIAQTMDELKARGCWIVGADMDGECVYKSNVKGSIVLVVGAEGKGLGRLVKQKCDLIVSLPMHGGVNSLNASNAAAVLMYEIVRQRLMGK
ncbi:MAG: 23S rRNA (guanosine(2251)-2'-O)-methyltransferase RlmB [Phascolarctobacterium sp.]|nr:23S rRNA (guanosine(2251)-2'-O)-methyltransferase RlmB [Phascolarctobacterium sp.]